MRLRICFFSILFSLAFLFLCSCCCYAGNLELRNLNYDVILNSDGTANITETWDIEIEYTNTLFKTFEIDHSKYSAIKDVSLIETTNGMNRNFSQIYQEKYHVDKNCFYALLNSKGEFEIAWGVHEDNSYARRTFQINYTIVDAVRNYVDCSEFYWQFISVSSSIPARKVTGNIHLPFNVETNEDFKVWAHGPLNGNITKISNDTAMFEIDGLSSYTMLEARVVTPTYIFEENENRISSNMLNHILFQEQQWANEANARREAIVRRQKNMKFFTIIFLIVTNFVGIFITIILIKKINNYKEALENAPNYKPTMPSKYYRDIPNEAQSPSQAAFLCYFRNYGQNMSIPNAISATILDLCLKKYLMLEVLQDKKEQLKIILVPDADISKLPKDEIVVYQMLDKVSPSHEFTMKDFEKYCKKHASSISTLYDKIQPEIKKELEIQASYDSNLIKQSINFSSNAAGFVFLTMISFLCMIASIIPSIICAGYCFKLAKKYRSLTQKGTDEKEAWIGLKNFMEDFSTMDKKEVPELVLWEKYLVYATAFGISDKVLKQLKVVYPQITDAQFMNSYGYTYLHLISSRNIPNNFIHSINDSVTSSYNFVNYSSGSGGGGGFSSGGGFGGGGGRNGRKIKNY